MKSLVHKLLAFTFVIALFTGCASVTDASQPEPQKTEVITDQSNNPALNTGEMNPIYDKPTW